MVIYYSTEWGESGEFLQRALRAYGAAGEIKISPHGKPYLEGGVKFSLADTEGFTAVAVGSQEVGLDAERLRPRKLDAILSRLTPAERKEDFFELWTAKEAFVKYLGGTLARLLPRLTYEKGALLLEGAPAEVSLRHICLEGCVLCICMAEAEEITLEKL